jgi:hypothetical protein
MHPYRLPGHRRIESVDGVDMVDTMDTMDTVDHSAGSTV